MSERLGPGGAVTLTMSETFSHFLRGRREALGLGTARFAELVGRSPSTVRGWERGRARPGDPATVSAIAAVLDVDEEMLAALITGEQVDLPEATTTPPPPGPAPAEVPSFFVPTGVSPLEDERVRRVPRLPTPPRRTVVDRADRGLRYQARVAATVVALVVLALLLRWALGGFAEAFGDLRASVFGP